MDLLDEVDTGAPPLAPFSGNGEAEEVDDEGGEDDGEDDEGGEDEDEDVVEVDAANQKVKKRRANNYTEIEDATLCRAWAAVGMDVVSGTVQTGKRYRQHIEDKFPKLMPRVRHPVDRTYRSLQCRWDAIKPACSR